MNRRELPPWAYLLGGLLLVFGSWINVLTGNFLLETLLICIGCWLVRWWFEVPADHPRFQNWLVRWWFEVPADHPRFQKMLERQFRIYRNMISACSWGMLIATVVTVCLSVFDVIP